MQVAGLHYYLSLVWSFFDIRAQGYPRRGLAAPRAGEYVRCMVEDWRYREYDIQVLRERGIETVGHPDSLLWLDERSVLFCLDRRFPIRQIVADIARPAMIIWAGTDDDPGDGGEGRPRPPPQ